MFSALFTRVPVVAVVATLCSAGTLSYPSGRPAQDRAARGGTAAERAAAPARQVKAIGQYDEHRIAAGTALPIALQTPLSSDSARRADVVEGRLLRAVTVGDVELVPAGAVLLGTVTAAEPARGVSAGTLSFTFTAIQHPETGSRALIRATVLTFRTELPRRGKALPVVALPKGTDASVTLLQPLVVRIPVGRS